jgi:DNA-directed RNA polymerase subunit RPC12/RpoP
MKKYICILCEERVVEYNDRLAIWCEYCESGRLVLGWTARKTVT